LRTEIFLPDVVGKGYGEYFRCRARYRVLKGGKGSKKSATTAINYIYRLMKHEKSNLLVVRAVFNTHKDSTFAQLKWAQEKLGVSHLWNNTLTPLEMTYIPTGQRILFRGFDDVLKLASTTVSKGYLCWVWVEEAYEIRSEADFDKLDLSVPRGNVPKGLFKQTTLTFNPWNREHWLKKRFFDKSAPDVKTFSTCYKVNEFLDETDRRIFERMQKENPRKYDVAGLGNWGVSEGLVYENWEVLDFDIEELLRSPNHKAFFGLDYGYTNDPTAFIAFFAEPSKKEMFIFDEFYLTGLLNSDIASLIIKKGYRKEKIRADAAEPKSNEDLRRLGISRIVSSVKGRDSVLNGINAVQEFKMYVHPRCQNTVNELSSYAYKKDTWGRMVNEPEDENNHLMDALRYAFYDVRFFKTGERKKAKGNGGIFPEDMKGEWY
jgi:phage terminase large subunit